MVRAPGRRCSPGLQPPVCWRELRRLWRRAIARAWPASLGGHGACGRAACLTARSLGFLCCLCGVPVLAVEAREADVAHAAHEIVGDPLCHVVRHEAALLRDAA